MGHDSFFTFIELELEGGWSEVTSSSELELRDVWNGGAFVAMGDDQSISIVEPEAAIRRFSFKQSTVIIINSMVSFDRSEMENEFSFDEEAHVSVGSRLKFGT